jgi:hypothetical protein
MMRLGRTGGVAALVVATMLLSACEGGLRGTLREAGVVSTPDEFLVLPNKPLEMPADLTALPPPTPGATNRADLDPEIEAVAALTGRAAPAGTASSPALVARGGPADPAIRPTLAAEDTTFRRDNRGRLFERWFGNNQERIVYGDVILDSDSEFDRQRAAGRRVPAAPPLQ